MRTCVGCRESKPKKELIRMVKNDDGVLVDRTGKANGRGIYLCDSKECFEKALKRKAIERGLELNMTDENVDKLNKDFFNKK